MNSLFTHKYLLVSDYLPGSPRVSVVGTGVVGIVIALSFT